MPKKDFTQVALDVVRKATGEIADTAPTPRQENSRKGGLRGGATRMGLLSAKERSDLAKKAAQARWSKD
jgi:hypothetical protein